MRFEAVVVVDNLTLADVALVIPLQGVPLGAMVARVLLVSHAMRLKPNSRLEQCWNTLHNSLL